MDAKTKAKIEELLSDPQRLKMKKPFTRGTSNVPKGVQSSMVTNVDLNEFVEAKLPTLKKNIVSQELFIKELDPSSHKVLFDQNIPTITMKLEGGGYQDVEYSRMTVPYQKMIRDKHILHLCGNPMQFTLMNTDPDEKQNKNFATFKQYWDLRNMDGLRTKMVATQKSFGDAGLLFYKDFRGQIKARVLSYEDGYVLCPHNDENGDRILESVYYQTEDGEYIDSYDDENMYRYQLLFDAEGEEKHTWKMLPPKKHGFSEIPLITKRGDVPWSCVQDTIDVYEIIYNIFLVIQKRHGWGILYIKGNFKDRAKKLAGAIVLNDTSMDGNGSAEFKAPPSPQNMIDTLSLMDETIQKGSGATFILPKDIKSAGDISAQAIMLTQSRDIETALQGVIEWQNVADKMCRLFKEGLSKELVTSGEREFETAVTDFKQLNINAKFKVWRPHNDSEYNSMLIQLKQSGCLSEDTAIEKNTESAPDEKARRKREREEEMAQKEREMNFKLSLKNKVENKTNKKEGGE